jgi:hypothetical protein
MCSYEHYAYETTKNPLNHCLKIQNVVLQMHQMKRQTKNFHYLLLPEINLHVKIEWALPFELWSTMSLCQRVQIWFHLLLKATSMTITIVETQQVLLHCFSFILKFLRFLSLMTQRNKDLKTRKPDIPNLMPNWCGMHKIHKHNIFSFHTQL